MDLERLKNALRVADAGSMTAAASALYITPVSLREQINRLEEELGFALFERSSRGVRPTEAGAVFFEALRPQLDAFDALLARCRRIGTAARRIRAALYAPYTFAQYCDRYRQLHPEVEFEYGESNFDINSDSGLFLSRNNYDIMQECYSPGFADQGLSFLPLWSEPYCCFLSHAHPLARRQTVSLDDLKGESVYAALALSLDVRLLDKRCREARIPVRRVPFSDLNILRLCSAGNVFIAEQSAAAIFSQLVCVPIVPETLLVHGIVYREPVNQPTAGFIAYLAETTGADALERLHLQCEATLAELGIEKQG